MLLECKSKGLRASKAKFPHQPQSSQFVRTPFSLLWLPWSFPMPVTSFKRGFPESRTEQGLPHSVQEKTQASFRWWQKSFAEPKETGSLTHLQFAPPFAAILSVCMWGGFSADPTKLPGCSAQVIWQDMENVPPGLSAALQLHGIFHCIWSPDTLQTLITEPSRPLAI